MDFHAIISYFKKIGLLVLVVSPLSFFFGVIVEVNKTIPVQTTAWVSWYENPQNEVYIGFETEQEKIGTIKYGTDKNNLIDETSEISPKTFHSINITGLNPDTIYYYQVEIEGSTFTSGQFRTAADYMNDFTFALTADTQKKFGTGWQSRIASIFNEKNYSFIAVVGDFVDEADKNDWNYYFLHAKKFFDTTPIVPVKGNHDRPRDLNGDGIDEDYFTSYFPQTADKVFNLNEYDTEKQCYYSFNWSSVHIQVLHFPEIDLDDEHEVGGLNPRDYYKAFTSDQINWIKQDLENAKDMPFRISLFHCPITGAGFYGPNQVMIDELLPILHEYNVTVTASGHAHHFERGTLVNNINIGNDLTYFIVGGGGGLADIALRPVPETDFCCASPSYTEVKVTSDTMTFTTFNFEGDILDNFIIHAGGV